MCRSGKPVAGINGRPKREQFLSVHVYRERKEEELSHLVSIGTCGLHTLHNSFKHGENATEWKLKKFL